MHEEQLPLDEQDLESRVQAALDRLERGYFTDKGTFVPAALARDVHRIVPLRASSDGLLRYYDDGVYREDGEATAAFVAQCLLGDRARTYYVSEAVAYIRRTEAVRPLSVDPDDTDVIRARNGIVNLRTDALTPYTPENATIVQLPWAYRHDAKCPQIREFLLSVFERDEDMVSLVFEIAGYLCWSRNSLRKAILLYGTGNNGKSILLYLLKCLLGDYNVAAVPLQRLGGDDRFAPSRLVGKLANICGDVGPNSARDMSLFKQITGGDPIYAERKGKDGFEFLCGAVPVFSANEFPRSPDTSRAYVNRWIAAECTARFEDNAAMEAELRALGEDQDEMEGFLAEAVRGAARLIERGDFCVPEKVRDTTEKYARGIDSVRSWLHDECELGQGYEIVKTEAHFAYRAYCEANSFHPLGRNKFYERVLNEGIEEGREAGNPSGSRVFIGMRKAEQDIFAAA